MIALAWGIALAVLIYTPPIRKPGQPGYKDETQGAGILGAILLTGLIITSFK